MASSIENARLLIESRLRDAVRGDPGACFDLGVAHSAGAGAEANLIEAYKWFDLAALAGYRLAENCRASVAWKMSARQIAEARRRTRLAQGSSARQVARFSACAFG